MKKTIQVRTKYVVLSGVMVAFLGSTAGMCSDGGGSSGQDKENKQQAQSTDSLVTNQPLHHHNWSQLRQNLQEVEDAEADGVQTTTFFFNQGIPDPVFSCPSIGAAIPATDQASNPQQTVEGGNGNGGYGLVAIGQMEPTGVYTGSSTGTYVMCVGGNGKPYAFYWEGWAGTIFADATWDKATHSVKVLGDPSFKFSKSKK